MKKEKGWDSMIDALIIKAFSIQGDKLLCPVCSAEDYTPDQPMCAYGDYPDTLFCPHCALTITFSQPSLDSKNERVYWQEHCLKKFIERFEK